MRDLLLATITALTVVACTATEPLREFSAREVRLIALDSLARSHPCGSVRATVLFDSSAWTSAHACAVAGRGLQVLGTARTHEPFMAPGDTARVHTIRVTRQRWCQLAGEADADPPGRMDSLSYVIEIEVPDRPHYIGVVVNAVTFAGGAWFDAHPRGLWGGSPHLSQPREAPDTLEAGAPCGLS